MGGEETLPPGVADEVTRRVPNEFPVPRIQFPEPLKRSRRGNEAEEEVPSR